MISRFLKFIPAASWMGLIFYMSSIQNLELQGELSVYDFILRKIAHMVEYGILTLLLYYFLASLYKSRKAIASSAIIATLYAFSDEFHQTLVPTRDGKMLDVLIDTTGIVIAIIVLYIWLKKLHKKH